MKAKLIILENPVIVTDEEIKEGGKFLTRDGNIFEYKNGYTPSDTNCGIEGCKKVINKPIDYNGIDFGIVDVEKLANAANGYNYAAKETKAPIFNEGFIEGFKASQQLNEKKFTSEDMRKAYARGFNNRDFESVEDESWSAFIASLSLPKTFEVEIEETETHIKILKKL